MTDNLKQAATKGAHHIGLTVPDLEATRIFFSETLGFEQVAERPEYPAVFLTDGTTMITLWQAQDPDKAVSFDRKNVIGLHHFALLVENHAALDAFRRGVVHKPPVVILTCALCCSHSIIIPPFHGFCTDWYDW